MTPTKPWSDILEYWFGTSSEDGGFDTSKNALWWGKSAEADAFVKATFGERIEQAAAGQLHWSGEARGRLALVVLIDQMRRNAYRDDPAMYAADTVARGLVLKGLETRVDLELDPIHRLFFYLPLEHSEDLQHQERAVQLCSELAESVSAQRDSYAYFGKYAIQHRDIIARFGRFPHRNAILGRSSTPEELAFLKEPNSSF